MSVHLGRASAPRRLIAGAAAVAFVGIGALTGLTTAGAQVSYPVIVPIPETRNQTCADLATYLTDEGYFEETPAWTETKIDPPANASNVGAAGFSVTDLVNTEPPSFDWSSTAPIAIVYVKSGQGASQVYLYNPATGATSGTDLTTNGGKQISHISACFGAVTPPPPPGPPTPPPAPPTPEVLGEQVEAGAQAPAVAAATQGAYTG